MSKCGEYILQFARLRLNRLRLRLERHTEPIAPPQNARDLAHSRTLRAFCGSPGNALRRGMRRPAAAFTPCRVSLPMLPFALYHPNPILLHPLRGAPPAQQRSRRRLIGSGFSRYRGNGNLSHSGRRTNLYQTSGVVRFET